MKIELFSSLYELVSRLPLLVLANNQGCKTCLALFKDELVLVDCAGKKVAWSSLVSWGLNDQDCLRTANRAAVSTNVIRY